MRRGVLTDEEEGCALQEEFLLPESPRLQLDKAAIADICRSMAAGSLLGVDLLYAVRWHTLPSSSEKMLHELYQHLEQIGQLIIRLAPSVCLAATNCDYMRFKFTSCGPSLIELRQFVI